FCREAKAKGSARKGIFMRILSSQYVVSSDQSPASRHRKNTDHTAIKPFWLNRFLKCCATFGLTKAAAPNSTVPMPSKNLEVSMPTTIITHINQPNQR